MSRESILICYDGSESAEHSFNAATGVLAGPKAIVADIGPVLTEIESYAAVIVIGSRGLTGVRERLKRSVSHQVAEHSGRPVLIVTPRHKRRYGPPPPRS